MNCLQPVDQKTLDQAPDPDLLGITNVSKDLPSDHEDIPVSSVSEPHTPLDGGGTTKSVILFLLFLFVILSCQLYALTYIYNLN